MGSEDQDHEEVEGKGEEEGKRSEFGIIEARRAARRRERIPRLLERRSLR